MVTRVTILFASFALVAASALANVPITPADELQPRAEHKRATRLITHFIANYHYKRPPLDDDLSAKILDRYVEMLDSTKSYLLASDIDAFSAHADALDDYLRQSNLKPVFDMYVRYRERLETRIDKAIALLDYPFDFAVDESFVFDREDVPWAKSLTELDELWRKRVKNDILSLSIAGKDDDEIRDTLKKRYEGIRRRTGQLNSEDVFQMFINAYTTSIDPHTAYFSPRTSENFKIRMSLSLEGIGAGAANGERAYARSRESSLVARPTKAASCTPTTASSASVRERTATSSTSWAGGSTTSST